MTYLGSQRKVKHPHALENNLKTLRVTDDSSLEYGHRRCIPASGWIAICMGTRDLYVPFLLTTDPSSQDIQPDSLFEGSKGTSEGLHE